MLVMPIRPADGIGGTAGAVMLSASTARLVDGAAALDAAELVQIKVADALVPARRLLCGGNPNGTWPERNLHRYAVIRAMRSVDDG